MKRKYTDMSFTLRTSGIYYVLKNICNNVQRQLIVNCELNSLGDNKRFSGLCDLASSMIINEINKLNNDRITKCKTIHGELSHKYIFDSKDWILEHTLVEIVYDNITIYIDATSGQFIDKNTSVPRMYISTNKPWYMLLDEDNIIYKDCIWKKINNKFKIINIGIIEILQYDVWGFISDIFRFFWMRK